MRRTSDMAAFMEVYNRTNPAIRDAAGNLVPGGGAYHPRLPRFVNSEQDTERAGGSISLQWRPTENTSVSLDGLLSRYQQERRDNYILGLSFGRNLSNNGQPMVSIRDVEFDDNGSMTYGLFDGVDVRSEGLVDQFVSKFEQLSLDMNHQFNDSFSVHAYAGRSINTWDGPLRFQTFMDAIDTDNFAVDFRGGRDVPRHQLRLRRFESRPTSSTRRHRTATRPCSVASRCRASRSRTSPPTTRSSWTAPGR